MNEHNESEHAHGDGNGGEDDNHGHGHEIKIIVNGREKTVRDHELSFEAVARIRHIVGTKREPSSGKRRPGRCGRRVAASSRAAGRGHRRVSSRARGVGTFGPGLSPRLG